MIFPAQVKVVQRTPKWTIGAKPTLKPLLRSLAQVKQCRHLGPELSRDPECGACTRHQCAKRGETKLPYCMQECQQWEIAIKLQQITNFPKIAIDPIKFDQNNLAPGTGGQRLNPSIIEYGDGYLFAYRSRWGRSRISVIRLAKDFTPVGKPKELNLHHADAVHGQEDPRLFWHKGQVHVAFTGWMGRKAKKHLDHTLFAKLRNDSFDTEWMFSPKLPDMKRREKNHAYFDLNGETYCVYSIVPHKVHKVYCEEVRGTWVTSTETSWAYGDLRGGASPVLHNGEFYHFFHGMLMLDKSHNKRLYTTGVAVFEAKPPFRITRITHEPLEIAGESPWGKSRVLFPCGAIFSQGQWVVSCGVMDAWSEIRFYTEQQVEAALTSI